MKTTNPVLALLVLVVLTATPRRIAAAGARSFKSGPIQITADGQTVWVANEDNDSVTRMNTSDESILEVVLPDAGGTHKPRGVSVREDGSVVWVACHDSDRVYVLDGTDGSVVAQVDLPWGSGPYSVALSPDQSTVLVTLHRAEGVAVVDAETYQVTDMVYPMYWSPIGIAWTEDGQSAWVTHLFAEGEHPYISQVGVSGGAGRLMTQVRVLAAQPQSSTALTAPYDIAEGGYLTTRGHPAQVPSVSGLRQLWLPTQYNNIHDSRYTPDSTIQTTMRHVDLDTRTIPNANSDKVIFTAVHVHDPTSSGTYRGPGWNAGISGPVDLGFSADGTMAYLLNELSDDLLVFPVNTPPIRPAGAAPLPEVAVGNRPKGLAVSPVTSLGYVYNHLSRDVSVVDLAVPAEVSRIALNPVTGESLGGAVLAGAKIFHTSADPRVSSNGKVSCASCHINAEHDGRSWAFHILPGPHGPREVPSLLGLNRTFGPPDPTTGFGQLHRSGDRDEVQDFEHTFQGVQMGGTGFLGGAVQPELGAPNAGLDAELDALAAYLFSLEPIKRSPYRTANGTLSEAAIRGATFFVGNQRGSRRGDAGCAECHIPEQGFVDLKFHDVGSRHDTNEEELNNRTPPWVVNTPTLVGVWTTPPYNGVSGFAVTILDVVKDQAARANSATPHGTPDGLTRRQLMDLAEFVKTIDGDMTAAEVRLARDTLPPRMVRVEAPSLNQIDVWFNESVQRGPVEDLDNWHLERTDGLAVPVTSVTWGSQNGDRATLRTQLQPATDYLLRALGGILDAADSASGGVANALDSNDPVNTRGISIGTRLTIRMGASGYEHLNVPVHDAAMVGPNLSTWSHDSVWLFPVNSGPRVNTGFVRFGWRDPFVQATGVSEASEIVEARLLLHGEYGDAQTVQLRRALQSWSDPASGGDWNQSASGAPTWRDHAHPSARWNVAGANALGGTGASVGDYNGGFDLASRVDATVSLTEVNQEVEFAGSLVTDAFRFWFENPSVDYGYGIRLTSSGTQELKFERAETGFAEGSPVLSVTYALPVVQLSVVRLAGGDVVVSWPLSADSFALESTGTPELPGSWVSVSRTVLSGNGQFFVMIPAAELDHEFFRLSR